MARTQHGQTDPRALTVVTYLLGRTTMDNPYLDQEPYGQAWDLGYQYGQANPADTDPAAPDLSSWGYDEETTQSATQVWREGALAGREESGASGGTDGGTDGDSTATELPFYDPETDTVYAAVDEFPALVELVRAGDVDTWLAGLGVDVSTIVDDTPNA